MRALSGVVRFSRSGYARHRVVTQMGVYNLSGQNRKDIKPGLVVDIVLKQDQGTGQRTRGVVKEILTNSPNHPHGIKVRLTTGEVGRVQEIIR